MGKPIISQKRGKASPKYTSPGFRSKGASRLLPRVESAEVMDIIDCPVHTSPLMKLRYNNGETSLVVAPLGIAVGDRIKIGSGAELKTGNFLPLGEVPEGTFICNIEGRPHDGGKFVKSSGASARVVSKTAKKVVVQFSSRKKKEFDPKCRTCIGVVAGGGRTEKPYLKAGVKYFAMKAKKKLWPKVSGSAMNAVAHPLGNKRSSRKSKAKPVSRHAPPGRKVGSLAARRTGRRRGRRVVEAVKK